MEFDMGGSRIIAAIMAAASAAAATGSAQQVEQIVLGMPQSMLFGGIAGALIGVVILPNKEARRVEPTKGLDWWRKAAVLSVRTLALAAGVLAFGALAGSTINAVMVFFHGIEAAGVSFSLILGAFIRPLLPKYLAGVEGVTERILGGVGAK